MAAWILEVTGAAPEAVLVAIEVPHGPVVESLTERGFRVHAINPQAADRFRDRFSPAGAKDDSRDAEVWATRCALTRAALRVAAARSCGGHGHGRALRSVADRLIGVACAMLEAKTIFDPNLASQRPLNLEKPTC